MTQTVLITGVGGFLGRYTARHFVHEGWRVLGIDEAPPENVQLTGIEYRRLHLPDAELAEWLRDASPTVCVHCAGRASVGLSLDNPDADFRANTVLTFELLDALRLHAPRCRFLLLSSAAVYGNPVALPVSEGQTLQPLSPYGYHKWQAELLCEEFARLHDLPTVSVRIFSAYGPGLRRQVMWDICEKVLTTGRLALRGTGEESRDFIHAADIARALHLLALHAPAQGEIYNLGSGREVTVAALSRLLLEALPSLVTAEFDGAATPGNPLAWQADISKIQALGFAPMISLEQGTRAVAAWCAAELGQP